MIERDRATDDGGGDLPPRPSFGHGDLPEQLGAQALLVQVDARPGIIDAAVEDGLLTDETVADHAGGTPPGASSATAYILVRQRSGTGIVTSARSPDGCATVGVQFPFTRRVGTRDPLAGVVTSVPAEHGIVVVKKGYRGPIHAPAVLGAGYRSPAPSASPPADQRSSRSTA